MEYWSSTYMTTKRDIDADNDVILIKNKISIQFLTLLTYVIFRMICFKNYANE